VQNASLITLFIADSTGVLPKAIQDLDLHGEEQVLLDCLALLQGIVDVEDIVLHILRVEEGEVGCRLFDIDIIKRVEGSLQDQEGRVYR
jgi:hypothetical protein